MYLSSFVLPDHYTRNLIDKHLSEINFTETKSALKQNKKDAKDILPFVTQYEPAVPNIKQVLMKKWHIIDPYQIGRAAAPLDLLFTVA